MTTWMDTLSAQWAPWILEAAQAIERGTPLGQALASVIRRSPEADAFFTSSGGQDFRLRDEFLFPVEDRIVEVRFASLATGRVISFDPGDDALLPALANLMWRCACGRMTAGEVRESIDPELTELFDSLQDEGFLDASPGGPQRLAEPGLHRLQHACLLHRSRSGGVLMDPVFHYEPQRTEVKRPIIRAELEGNVDAIFISHWHYDHFHLPTLMMFPPETPVFVPKVPRASALCGDMAARLRSCGFTRVRELDWYAEPVRVADLEVFAVPFYGEQPLQHGPTRHPDLRNWGNTYVCRAPGLTSWALVDSGNDERGTMAEVAGEVLRRIGSVDVVLSNLRQFTPIHAHYISGTGTYWLALPPEEMRRFSEYGFEQLTLGPAGVAEICRKVRAKHVLPYAHWWHEPGTPPGEGEGWMLQELTRALEEQRAPTTVIPWTVADRVSFAEGIYTVKLTGELPPEAERRTVS